MEFEVLKSRALRRIVHDFADEDIRIGEGVDKETEECTPPQPHCMFLMARNY